MTAIEGVAFGLDAGEQVLPVARLVRCGPCLMGLFGVEDGPVVGLEGCGSGIGFRARDLLQVAKVPHLHAGIVGCAGAGHVDGHRLLDAATLHCLAEARGAADLLGHGENLETVLVGFGLEDAGIGLDSVEIKHIGIGRDLAGLMQGHGRFDEGGVAAAEDVEKHVWIS